MAATPPGRFDAGDKTPGPTDQRRAHDQPRDYRPAVSRHGHRQGMVEAYLASPDTPCTEAVAAMGPVCPFFERAGMTAPDRRPGAQRSSPPTSRCDGLDADDLLRPIRDESELADVLRTGRDRAPRPGIAGGAIREIARAAACTLIAPPTAYAHRRVNTFQSEAASAGSNVCLTNFKRGGRPARVAA